MEWNEGIGASRPVEMDLLGLDDALNQLAAMLDATNDIQGWDVGTADIKGWLQPKIDTHSSSHEGKCAPHPE